MSLQALEDDALTRVYSQRSDLAPYDELVSGGVPRPHNGKLVEHLEAAGSISLKMAVAEARNLIADGGVTGAEAEPWRIDPLPVVLADWEKLEAGLIQRARLNDALYSDLYGEQKLLRRGVLPAEAVLTNPGYTRFAVGGAKAKLALSACDLGRDADGNWQVLASQCENPVGMGYAMVGRRVVAQVFSALHRESELRRLRNFYHQLAATLMEAAPDKSENPRVALFTAGIRSRYGSDQGYLATLLGFALAEADDIITQNGRLWLRTGDELEPLEVVLRCVPSADADPLEFSGDAAIGVPGMAQALRAGRLAAANPLGSAVLDSPALLPYLPRLARELLGEDLALPSPQVWWCFDTDYTQTHLGELVLREIGGRGRVIDGSRLTVPERSALLDQINARPERWCGAEPLPLSSTPVVAPGGLEPRRFILRSFQVWGSRGYSVMPGGFGRVGFDPGQLVIGVDSLAKDVWVGTAASSGAVEPLESVGLRSGHGPVAISPRVAGTLAAIGRFAERASSKARLLRRIDDLASDYASNPGTPGHGALDALLAAASAYTTLKVEARSESEPGQAAAAPTAPGSEAEYVRRVALGEIVGGLRYDVGRLLANTAQVRDLMSSDVWSVLGRLERTLTSADADSDLQAVLGEVVEALLSFSGIHAESMVRDSSWAFLDAGMRTERARFTLELLRTSRAASERLPKQAQEFTAEEVLRVADSVISYRRRAAVGIGPVLPDDAELGLLVDDTSNPRSIAFQYTALAFDMETAGDRELAQAASGLLAPSGWDARMDALDFFGAKLRARHFSRQAPRMQEVS
ncbi:MAG: circularly permuted type 2 ATP-grasp protein [Propionibacteriaceae bacterium]|jgi:uncharacterized circularly permuted ATP-grasp superfamily protein/uncharacterized alpha-E superfamily protein|nr:circularly permuted type 2 ATP-grasp protein [Propionibacteriaceae bacterium]